ncbi:MAG: hypothetical protein ABEJ82_05310 [Haloplanus sp.]
MKFKPVPEAPADLAVVTRAQRALPLVPDAEADCCGRLLDRVDLPDRETAQTWLTFLRALGLAEETDRGFRRTRVDADPETLRTALLDRVFAADAVWAALEAADGPLTADEAFDRVRESVPEWERHRNPGTWEAVWRERVGRLLSWLVLLGGAERVGDGDDARYAPV